MKGLLLAMLAERAISALDSAAEAEAQIAPGAGPSVYELRNRLDRLTLACVALWELLQQCSDLTEEDLMAKVKEVDLRDGAADGKIASKVSQCRKCGRVMSVRHQKCLYCGAAKLDAKAFDATL